jgi:hypothetical protein
VTPSSTVQELTSELQTMAGQDYQVPDLASVLKTLASFVPPGPQNQGLSTQPQPQNSSSAQALTSKSSEAPPAAPAPKLIDPATITDWSSGLRCVMKTVAAHENIIREIRRVSCINLSLNTILTKADDKSPTRARRAVVGWSTRLSEAPGEEEGKPEEAR